MQCSSYHRAAKMVFYIVVTKRTKSFEEDKQQRYCEVMPFLHIKASFNYTLVIAQYIILYKQNG